MVNLDKVIRDMEIIIKNAADFRCALSSCLPLSRLKDFEYSYDSLGIFTRFSENDTVIEINISEDYKISITREKCIDLNFKSAQLCLQALVFILSNLENEELYDTQQNIERNMLL